MVQTKIAPKVPTSQDAREWEIFYNEIHNYFKELDVVDWDSVSQTTSFTNQTGPGNRTGIIIPLYVFPTDVYNNTIYNGIMDLKKTYHGVPVTVILNPDSGPGTRTRTQYTTAIDRLKGAGIHVIGYVSTAYTANTITKVKRYVDDWLTYYPEIQGIFFDEMTNTDNDTYFTYYNEIGDYAHTKQLYPTIGNPGARAIPDYYTLDGIDVVMMHEASTYPTENQLKKGSSAGLDQEGDHMFHNFDRRAALVYGQSSFDVEEFALMRKYTGWVYVTQDDSPNPWDEISDYMEDMFKILAVNTSIHVTGSAEVEGNIAVGGTVDGVDIAAREDTLLRTTCTALISGGIVTINTDTTKVDITAITAQIIDSTTDPSDPVLSEISVPATTGLTITNVATQTQTVIGVDANGDFQQQVTQFTPKQRRSIIQLAAVVHFAGVATDVTDIRTPLATNQTMNFYDLGFMLGVINRTGNEFSANGANLKIDKSVGETFLPGVNFAVDSENPNIFTEPAKTALTFITVANNGADSTGFFASTDTVDPNYYDDGSGTLAAVPTNNYTIQRIAMGVGGGPISIAYGQNLYTSQLAAVTSIETQNLIRFPEEEPLLIRAYLVVRQGSTDLSDDNQAVFIQASKFGDLKFTESSKDVSTRAIPSYKSYTFTSNGILAGTYYVAGYYSAPVTDANLDEGSLTQVYGTANISYAAHAFIVAAAAGVTDGSDLILTVTGTSITDNGVRTPNDSEVIVADCTAVTTDTYLETPKKWIGQITYTLSSTTGTVYNFDFNYGLCKYDDMGNRDFILTDLEAVGLCGGNDTAFDIKLKAHTSSGWTYSAAAFSPGNGDIAILSTDHSTESNLSNNESFAYKRTNLATFIEGAESEGFIVEITTGANNAIQAMDVHIGVEF